MDICASRCDTMRTPHHLHSIMVRNAQFRLSFKEIPDKPKTKEHPTRKNKGGQRTVFFKNGCCIKKRGRLWKRSRLNRTKET